MRRKAFSFTAPARVTDESVVGLLVVTGSPVSVDLATKDLSTRVIVGHLKVLGLELVPVEKPRRPWWRPNRKGGSQ